MAQTLDPSSRRDDTPDRGPLPAAWRCGVDRQLPVGMLVLSTRRDLGARAMRVLVVRCWCACARGRRPERVRAARRQPGRLDASCIAILSQLRIMAWVGGPGLVVGSGDGFWWAVGCRARGAAGRVCPARCSVRGGLWRLAVKGGPPGCRVATRSALDRERGPVGCARQPAAGSRDRTREQVIDTDHLPGRGRWRCAWRLRSGWLSSSSKVDSMRGLLLEKSQLISRRPRGLSVAPYAVTAHVLCDRWHHASARAQLRRRTWARTGGFNA